MTLRSDPSSIHSLLARQVQKHLGPELGASPRLEPFLAAVDEAYRQFETERLLGERSLELSSRELHEANAHMRAVFQAVPDAFARVNAAGEVVDVRGGRTAMLFLRNQSSSTRKTVVDLFPPELRDAVEFAIDEVRENGRPSSLDVFLDSDGEREVVEARFLPMLEGELLLVLHDIRERKLAEEENRRSQELLSAIFDGAAEGICQLDPEGRVAFVNRSSERMLGRAAGELIGRDFHALVHASKEGCCSARPGGCAFASALRSGAAFHNEHESFSGVNGSSFLVEVVFSPLSVAEQGCGGAVLTFRDVTERDRLRSQLAEVQRLESIGQLAAGIAHEINTPTQYIGDNTRFVRDSMSQVLALLSEARKAFAAPASAGPGALDELQSQFAAVDLDFLLQEIPSALDQSLDGIGHVARIVRSMKEFAHPGADEIAPADLNKAIESTTVVARNEWKYVAELVLELDPELPPVPCMLGSINQVVLNLIVNASHAIEDRIGRESEQRGRITIRTHRDGDWVQIDVRDTGTGIPEAARGRIFDPFFTTKAVGRGTGQGLTLAHTVVVEKHHGSLTFDTELGVGTVFHVRLPLLPVAAPSH
ncbi:MAG: PAS domain-containing protein [Planctomycetes bacterium]|nr:PAS domain-containing protein [Planctomycetota bacterium]